MTEDADPAYRTETVGEDVTLVYLRGREYVIEEVDVEVEYAREDDGTAVIVARTEDGREFEARIDPA